jgi:ABC-type Co2+ transport system permease subunit
VICYKSSKESEGGVDIVTAIAIGVIAVIGLAATIIVVKKKNKTDTRKAEADEIRLLLLFFVSAFKYFSPNPRFFTFHDLKNALLCVTIGLFNVRRSFRRFFIFWR